MQLFQRGDKSSTCRKRPLTTSIPGSQTSPTEKIRHPPLTSECMTSKANMYTAPSYRGDMVDIFRCSLGRDGNGPTTAAEKKQLRRASHREQHVSHILGLGEVISEHTVPREQKGHKDTQTEVSFLSPERNSTLFPGAAFMICIRRTKRTQRSRVRGIFWVADSPHHNYGSICHKHFPRLNVPKNMVGSFDTGTSKTRQHASPFFLERTDTRHACTGYPTPWTKWLVRRMKQRFWASAFTDHPAQLRDALPRCCSIKTKMVLFAAMLASP